MVIYKETVFAIAFIIGLMAIVGLIMMRKRSLKGNTGQQEETPKPDETADFVEDYLREHHPSASTVF